MPLLFVYGSLKQGFPNFHVNKGHRIEGEFMTALPHPFFLLNGRLPCLLPATGAGLQVMSQVFEVTPATLSAMDELERVGQSGGYSRIEIDVVPRASPAAQAHRAFVYVQDPALLAQQGDHVGPIAEYTAEHATRLRW